jgi:hypothetical protein
MQVIDIQPTPNPNALKFIVASAFPAGSHAFMNSKEAEKDAIAKEIFSLGEIASVFYMNSFLTVGKTPSGNWSELQPKITEVLARY